MRTSKPTRRIDKKFRPNARVSDASGAQEKAKPKKQLAVPGIGRANRKRVKGSGITRNPAAETWSRWQGSSPPLPIRHSIPGRRPLFCGVTEAAAGILGNQMGHHPWMQPMNDTDPAVKGRYKEQQCAGEKRKLRHYGRTILRRNLPAHAVDFSSSRKISILN